MWRSQLAVIPGWCHCSPWCLSVLDLPWLQVAMQCLLWRRWSWDVSAFCEMYSSSCIKAAQACQQWYSPSNKNNWQRTSVLSLESTVLHQMVCWRRLVYCRSRCLFPIYDDLNDTLQSHPLMESFKEGKLSREAFANRRKPGCSSEDVYEAGPSDGIWKKRRLHFDGDGLLHIGKHETKSEGTYKKKDCALTRERARVKMRTGILRDIMSLF